MTFIDRRAALLTAICIASFLEPLATTVVVVALPDIQQTTGAGFAELQWIINAYVVSFAALVLTGGSLADRYGRKRIFQVGLLAFLADSVACGLASLPVTLIAGRGIAGLGSAFMLSAGLALLVQEFQDEGRIRAFSIWGVAVYLPLYFQGPLGYGPTRAGLALLPLGVPLLLMGPASARLAARMSPKRLLPLGLLTIAVGIASMALAPRFGVGAVYVGMFVAGVGAGLINGELSNVAIGAVVPERGGMASGINNTMRQLGYGVGIAGLGSLFGGLVVSDLADHGRDFAERVAAGDIAAAVAALPVPDADAVRSAANAAFADAFATLCLVAAGIAAIGALLVFVLIREQQPGHRPSSLAIEGGSR